MKDNRKQNTKVFELITSLAIGLFLLFIFIKFLYF